MRRLGMLIAGVACAGVVWACSDDSSSGDGARAAADAGVDVVSYPPPLPPQPLDCVVSGTFDPCDAGMDPTVFYAAENDAGVDASAITDAGIQPSTGACIASGATRVACDGGTIPARFDLAIGDAGESLAVGLGYQAASRFTIGVDGKLSAPTALASNVDDLRIVSGGGTVATIAAAEGTDHFSVVRDNVPNDGATDLQGHIGDKPAIRGAFADDDGTVYTLLSGNHFQQLAPNQSSFEAKLQTVSTEYMGWGPHGGVVFASPTTGGFALHRAFGTDVYSTYASDGSVFATGRGVKGESLVALFGPAENELQIAAVPDPDQVAYVHWTIARDRPCGLDETGCGYTCTEKIRALSPIGQFVATDDASYFVTVEAHVSETRTYSTDFDVVCGIFGGCACGSQATLDSVDGLDVVALQIDVTARTITERARARVELADPRTALFTSHLAEHDVIAVAKGGKIHVGVQGATGEIARIVLNLSN